MAENLCAVYNELSVGLVEMLLNSRVTGDPTIEDNNGSTTYPSGVGEGQWFGQHSDTK